MAVASRTQIILGVLTLIGVVTTAVFGNWEKLWHSTTADSYKRIYMKIKPISLYPDNPDAEVQLTVFVNDITYSHPSIGGVQWMKVGPNMSDKILELPKAVQYDVRFEMLLRTGTKLVQAQHAPLPITHTTSQEVMPVPAQKLPFSETYKLYPVAGLTRGAGVSAVVPYEIYGE